MILEPDGLFRMATTNFQQAEMHLADTEVQLRRLLVRLEQCAAAVRQIPPDVQLWRQVDGIFKREPAGAVAAGGTPVSG